MQHTPQLALRIGLWLLIGAVGLGMPLLHTGTSVAYVAGAMGVSLVLLNRRSAGVQPPAGTKSSPARAHLTAARARVIAQQTQAMLAELAHMRGQCQSVINQRYLEITFNKGVARLIDAYEIKEEQAEKHAESHYTRKAA